MPAREIIEPELNILGTSVVTISTATTTAFDFGTPNDINLATTTAGAPGLAYEHGNRVLVILSASTAGTTDTVSFSIQDAPDSSGSIGTPATALTTGTLTGGTGSQFARASVRLQNGRPWLRVRVTSDGTTDTFVTHCTVLGLPGVL
ncbi:hypothetical protein QTQ03_16665 [Micromonospora sp. WMMA1363]|uniref:hypothetical protein n=1 Tax=Micromonospora sp. WMMA1363 TaxID=3053985 RepID=UPI00259CA0D7|nr:hypothetical protein [Micromonospora sp. WMMA1363]MDM4721152.1 hypothetical protein [Micromonospora sp. WMMA1363]